MRENVGLGERATEAHREKRRREEEEERERVSECE